MQPVDTSILKKNFFGINKNRISKDENSRNSLRKESVNEPLRLIVG